MSDSPRLSTPRLRVVLDDGSEFDVRTYNPDLVMWDRERARRKWPTAQEAPFVWLTFLAWRALLRTGDITTGTTLDDFTARTLEVSSAADDDYADPTQQEATPDSS